MKMAFHFCAFTCAVCLLFTVPARAADFVMSSAAAGFRVTLPESWSSLPREESTAMAAAAAAGVVAQEHKEAVSKLAKGARKKRIPVENTAFFTIVSVPYGQTILSGEDLDIIQNEPDVAVAEILQGMDSAAKSRTAAKITASKQDKGRALLCYSAENGPGKTGNVCIAMRPVKTRIFIMMGQWDGPWDAALQEEIVGVMERAQLRDPGPAQQPRKAARSVKKE